MSATRSVVAKMQTPTALEKLARGEDVLAWLKQTTPSISAVKSALSRIKAAALAQLDVPDSVYDALAPYAATEEDVAAFLKLPLARMVDVQRKHAHSPTWSAAAEEALAALALVPPRLEALKLSPSDVRALKAREHEQRLKRGERMVVIPNAMHVLEFAVTLARTSAVDMPIPRLALPLLLLSGRRTAELLNGASTFQRTSHPTALFFDGQVKKHQATAYAIPLLCSVDDFLNAFHVLRAAQRHVVLDNAQTHTEYAHALQAAVAQYFPFARSPHVLRAAYAALVHATYDFPGTFNNCAMRILGHATDHESLAYNYVKVEGATRTFGPLP